MESRNKERQNHSPNFALKYHASANFFIGGREISEMAVVFGECGRECLSGPGNPDDI
jgi:hypothetical protein